MSARVREAIATFDGDVHAARQEIGALVGRVADEAVVPVLLGRLFQIDQHLRRFSDQPHEQGFDAGEGRLFEQLLQERWRDVDGFCTSALKQILAAHGWPTIARFGRAPDNHAWIVAQHADHDRVFQREVLALLGPLTAQGQTDPAHYAYLFDRVAVGEGRPQRYGTQGRCLEPGRWAPREIEDPDGVDARRTAVGLGPLAEYIDTMKGFCR